MKRVEIKYTAIMKELEKLNAKLERAQKALQKKKAAAEKYGVATMTVDEHREWLKTVPKTEDGWITDKEAIKKNGAWFDLFGAEREVEDIERQIVNAEARHERAEEKLTEYRKEVAQVEDLKTREALMKQEFEQEQKEWAKDGIKLEKRYAGSTPGGKRFSIERNSGMTERSWHCYTLYLEGAGAVFTSGEFWRAYSVIKNN